MFTVSNLLFKSINVLSNFYSMVLIKNMKGGGSQGYRLSWVGRGGGGFYGNRAGGFP